MLATGFRGADLVFDAERHEYTLPDGRRVPNVTTILKATGVSTDFDAIAARSSRDAANLEYRRSLGTAAHADCHAFDDDDLDWSAVHPDVLPYVKAWEVFRENSYLTPIARERRVFHPHAFYCGTLDGIFRKPDGSLVLIDMALGDPFDAAKHLQTAGYVDAYTAEHPEVVIAERWAVRLLPERRVPYEKFPYTDWSDFNTFRAVLTTYNQHPSRRRAA